MTKRNTETERQRVMETERQRQRPMEVERERQRKCRQRQRDRVIERHSDRETETERMTERDRDTESAMCTGLPRLPPSESRHTVTEKPAGPHVRPRSAGECVDTEGRWSGAGKGPACCF